MQQDELKSTIQSVFSKYFDVTEVEISNTFSKKDGYCFHVTIHISNSTQPFLVDYDTKYKCFCVRIYDNVLDCCGVGSTLNGALTKLINRMSEQLTNVNNIINSFNK